MAKGTINGGNYNNIYSYYIEWEATSNGSEANTSNLVVKWIYKKNKTDPYNAYNSTSSTKIKFNIDGSDTSEEVAHFDLRSASIGSTQVLRTYTTTVRHNDDGTRKVRIGGTHTPGNSWSTATISPIEVTLDTIPRKTACPSLSGDIESSYNIALNPATSSFTHSVYVTFGSETGYINASGNLQSEEYKFSNNNILFTIPSSFYQQFDGKSGSGTLRLRTYNGSSNIGETTATLIANCLESRCRPSISGTVKDSNDITKALTGNDNKLVKYFSDALLTLTLKAATTSGDTTSTITSRSVDGTTFSGASVILDKVTKKDFTVTITNSRGFSTSEILSASELIEYFTPSIVINPYRYPDQTSSQVRLTYSGSFFNQNFGNAANTITIKWYWKLSYASEWTLGGTITPTLNGNNINENTIDCGSTFDYQNAYRFKLEVIDKLSSEGTKEADVTRGVPIYSHGEDWFQHHTDVYSEDGYKFLDENKTKELFDENSKEIYSTKEMPIGIWIDGKTIYNQVIETTTRSDTEYKDLISNIDIVIKASHNFIANTSTKESYPNNMDIVSYYVDDTGTIKFRVKESTSWYINKKVYFVLEYTKRID